MHWAIRNYREAHFFCGDEKFFTDFHPNLLDLAVKLIQVDNQYYPLLFYRICLSASRLLIANQTVFFADFYQLDGYEFDQIYIF